jgi:hypothetical protein
MSASQFTSMRQLMMKNMPASALDNPPVAKMKAGWELAPAH